MKVEHFPEIFALQSVQLEQSCTMRKDRHTDG